MCGRTACTVRGGGGWKRSDLAMITAVKRPAGESRGKVAAGPNARQRHRASPPTLPAVRHARRKRLHHGRRDPHPATAAHRQDAVQTPLVIESPDDDREPSHHVGHPLVLVLPGTPPFQIAAGPGRPRPRPTSGVKRQGSPSAPNNGQNIQPRLNRFQRQGNYVPERLGANAHMTDAAIQHYEFSIRGSNCELPLFSR